MRSEGKSGIEGLLEALMAEDFPKLMKNINP